MLARLLRALLIAQALAALAWWIFCWRAGRPGLGAAGVLLLAAAPSLVLGFEFLLLVAVRRGDPAPQASAVQLLRAWVGECGWSSRAFGWEQAFRAERWPDRLGPRGQRGVVFVHGYFCNRGIWNPWLARCTREGRPFVAVSLEPVFGNLDDYVAQIEAAVARIEAATGLAPVIVGHSMGGLVLRAWLATTPGATQRAHRLFTIGTPHLGTWMARWSRTINARSMRPSSPWLGALTTREAAADLRHAPGWRTCFWGHADNIVMPPSVALWPGAKAHHLPATAHVAMAFHAAVLSEVFDGLADADADAEGPGSAFEPIGASAQPARSGLGSSSAIAESSD